MRLFRPVPRRVARAVSLLVVAAWVVTMGVVLNRAYLQARSFNLATDLARYGSAAEWRGVYYRGEKIGFTVSQTNPTADGFELLEDARLQMSLLGATTAAMIRTSAQLDREFALRSFDFSLDPGTGARAGDRPRLGQARQPDDQDPERHADRRARSGRTCRC